MNDDSFTAKLVYILYLVSLVFGITGLVGLVIAYINKGDGSSWLDSHYRFQIRTFWIGLLYSIIGGLTVILLIGYVILLFTLIWFIVRCVVGYKYLNRNQAYPAPASWLF
ncbi:hypothetical protein D5125_05890 [Magnetovirga frankeli]|uniref:DUF4870 family protein n=1 Tax=Magnetovirga frankeli TaxID=947516 RepID=UPI001294170C|nr:hypothetical protein D5125_05890 [gamma proteobacterium SS-5]